MEASVESRALDGAWRRLMRFPRANASPPRVLGTGWKGWIHRHWRETSAGALGGLAIVGLATATFFLLGTVGS